MRAPVSFKTLDYDIQTDTLTWKAMVKSHFRSKERYFSELDFITWFTHHIQPIGKSFNSRYSLAQDRNLVRQYGVYSVRGKRNPRKPLLYKKTLNPPENPANKATPYKKRAYLT